MKSDSPPVDRRRQRTVNAIVHFAAMMHSYEKGKLSEAADAQTELKRLGLDVRFCRPAARIKGVENE